MLNHTLSISLFYSTHKVSKSHFKSSQDDFLSPSSATNFQCLSSTKNWLVPQQKEFRYLYSRGSDTHNRKQTSRDHHSPLRTSPRTRKTQPLLMLLVRKCLRSCCLKTHSSNPLQYILYTLYKIKCNTGIFYNIIIHITLATNYQRLALLVLFSPVCCAEGDCGVVGHVFRWTDTYNCMRVRVGSSVEVCPYIVRLCQIMYCNNCFHHTIDHLLTLQRRRTFNS
jgi:hypothetical protein